MSIPFTPGSFQPPVGPYQKYENFYLWVQKTLPTIYDDTLSYQELLAKVLYQLNLIGEQGNQITDDVTALNTAYGELQDWANENISELVSFVNDYFDNLDVQQEINNKLDGMAQDGSLSALLDPIVALQIPDLVTGWLGEHVDPDTGYVIDDTLTIQGAAADAKATGDAIGAATSNIENIEADIYTTPTTFSLSDLSSGYYYTLSNNHAPTTTANASSLYTANPIDLSNYIGQTLKIVMSKISSFGIRYFGFLDSAQLAHSGYYWTSTNVSNNFTLQEDGTYFFEKEIKYPYFVFSCNTDVTAVTIIAGGNVVFPVKSDLNTTFYISTSGNDTNSGKTMADAKATINAALEAGGETILIAGGVYEQRINLNLVNNSKLKLFAYDRSNPPIFYSTGTLISNTETLDTQGTSSTMAIYKTPCTQTFTSSNLWIFQDGVADESTRIQAGTRHALQRGRVFRCSDTKIEKVSASTLSEAKAEMAEANTYKWFLNESDHYLYFTRPATVDASHPIRGCFIANPTLFTESDNRVTVEICGIVSKYMAINLNKTMNSTLSDCSVGNVRANGCYTWDEAIGAKFYRCEAQRCFLGENGDGFNAHSTPTTGTPEKTTTAILFDCWSHDNMDDGYSDHERCETTIYGGLFENNQNGGGVTPALGSHCTCYNAVSRFNLQGGFRLAGTAAASEGGIGTQLDCFNCISDNNGSSSQGGGYVAPSSSMTENDLFICSGCVAMNEVRGYSVQGSGKMLLINCQVANCTQSTSGTGTIEKITTQAV